MSPGSGGIFPSAEAQQGADARDSGETHIPGIRRITGRAFI